MTWLQPDPEHVREILVRSNPLVVHPLDSKTLRPNAEPDDEQVALLEAAMSKKHRYLMSDRDTISEDRRKRILFHLKFRGAMASVPQLIQELKLARSVAHRDMTYLRAHNLVTSALVESVHAFGKFVRFYGSKE